MSRALQKMPNFISFTIITNLYKISTSTYVTLFLLLWRYSLSLYVRIFALILVYFSEFCMKFIVIPGSHAFAEKEVNEQDKWDEC